MQYLGKLNLCSKENGTETKLSRQVGDYVLLQIHLAIDFITKLFLSVKECI